MNKPIADRFYDQAVEYTGVGDKLISVERQAFVDWLKIQPENSRTFTLAEVEQIAREAFSKGVAYSINTSGWPFDPYWREKLKELRK